MIDEQLRVRDYTLSRKVMQEHNSDPVKAGHLVGDEAREFLDVIAAIEHGEMTQELRKMLLTEGVDLVWLVLNIFNQLGADFQAEFREKEARNICKRPVSEWQDGTYAECDKKARREWTSLREAEFYQIPD